MTAAVILLTFLASMILYRFTEWDGYLFGLSFYVLTALSGMVCATGFALRGQLVRNRYKFAAGNGRSIIGVGVLWLNFLASHVLWSVGDEHYIGAQVLDFATALYFVLAGQTRWEWTIGGIFLASVAAGFAGMMGWLPPLTGGFLSLTFPFIAGFCGDLAAAVLGLGAGDSGLRLRAKARVTVRWKVA